MTLRGYPGLSPANTTEDRARVRSQIIPAAAGWRIVFSIYTNISTIYRMDGGLICSARSCCVLSTLASGPPKPAQDAATGAVSPAVRSSVTTAQESVPAPVSPVSWCRHTARMPPHHLLLSLPVTLIPHPPLARATVSSSTFTGAPTTRTIARAQTLVSFTASLFC